MFSVLVGGCSTAPTESLGEFRETVYVEGYLRAGSPVSDLFVGTTMPLSSVYDREASALSDALVTIEVDGVSYELSPVVDRPGYYEQPDLIVESGKTYHLSVTTGLGTATAQTTVPVAPQVSGASTLLIGGDAYRVTWEGETKGGYVTTRKSVERCWSKFRWRLSLEDLVGVLAVQWIPRGWAHCGIALLGQINGVFYKDAR